MEDILYVKIEQNIPVQKLEQEIFYTLPKDCQQKTMFTIGKVFEGIHKVYPSIQIENIGEKDFIVDLEEPDQKEKSRAVEFAKAAFVSLVAFFGAAFTIMTFNEDVSVSSVFDKVYKIIMGTAKQGGSILEISYAIGLPAGILIFYNHFRRRKIKNDPTPIQVEMRTYEEQVNKALISTASREGHTIDVN